MMNAAASRHAIGYCRVSTHEQAKSGLGLADQRAAIQAAADQRGWLVDYVIDEGLSGKTLRRPGVARALEMLRDGDAQVLVVAKLDRLSRSLMDFAALMDRARREGWELVALDLGVDTTTPGGEMMASVMAAFAQYERRLIGQRTSAALQQLKAQGVRLGRPSAIPEMVVKRIRAERDAGASLRSIAEGLNRDGVPTAQGGARWHASTVQGSLRAAEADSLTNAIA